MNTSNTDNANSQHRTDNHNFPCFCGSQFKSKRGLSQHQLHHPAKVNAERVAALPTKRLALTQEDDEALKRHADRHWERGMMKTVLFTLLAPYFLGRSHEAIKKRLQLTNWVPPTPQREQSTVIYQTTQRDQTPLHTTSAWLHPPQMEQGPLLLPHGDTPSW